MSKNLRTLYYRIRIAIDFVIRNRHKQIIDHAHDVAFENINRRKRAEDALRIVNEKLSRMKAGGDDTSLKLELARGNQYLEELRKCRGNLQEISRALFPEDGDYNKSTQDAINAIRDKDELIDRLRAIVARISFVFNGGTPVDTEPPIGGDVKQAIRAWDFKNRLLRISEELPK